METFFNSRQVKSKFFIISLAFVAGCNLFSQEIETNESSLFFLADLKKNPNEDYEDLGRGPAGHNSSPRVFFSDVNTYNPPFHRRHPFGVVSKSGRW